MLLSSQSHDAIDNALERLHKHPSIKAIRLNRDDERIKNSPYAKEDALRQYYSALKNHAQNILHPFNALQDQIENLKEWTEKVDYVQKDLELTRTQIETLSLKITEKQTALRKEQNAHQETLEAHKKECQATRGVVLVLDG